jgi:hypothetical protein
MKRKILAVLVFTICACGGWSDEIDSLSQVFLTGKGVEDTDADTFADKIAIYIVIPDNPNPHEIALASDIAARANLESLVANLSMVKKESDTGIDLSSAHPVLIGNRTKWANQLVRQGKIVSSSLKEHQGSVTLFKDRGQTGIAIVGGSPDALLQTGRAFFLRWPYIWDIWGREEGVTYLTCEDDLAKFFEESNVRFERAVIRALHYEFPLTDSPHESLQRLQFNNGEVQTMRVRIDFPDVEQKDKAFRAFEELKSHHHKGQRTHLLTYSGCAQIVFELYHGLHQSEVPIRRVGYPKRLLTPSYKSVAKPKVKEKDFDLISMFSSKGLYSDTNGDKIIDKIDSKIIIPQETCIEGVTALASRLVLTSTGASFPLLYLDKEIEDEKGLVTPILLSSANTLSKSLIKTGKLKPQSLQPGMGKAVIIPEAFNASNALALMGGDREGLEKIVSYLSLTFPYIDEYGEGHANIQEIPGAVEEFLTGKNGSAEAFFKHQLETISADIADKDLESFQLKLYLPQENKRFESAMDKYLKETLRADTIEVLSYRLEDSRSVFSKEKQFPWEGDEAFDRIQSQLPALKGLSKPVKIHLGVSESPEVRQQLKRKIEDLLEKNRIADFEVDVLSSYKQGFFWLTEQVLPNLKDNHIDRITIRFAEEKDDFNMLKRFYAESYRWLQELYPVDEIIARDTGIPLANITFEKKEEEVPVYEVFAYGEKSDLVFTDSFSPRVVESLYMNVLPEWGTVRRTSGWLSIEQGTAPILNIELKTDLEKFWDYYQEEILPEVQSYILEKTGNEPSFTKQPYFKRLLIELWFSEPDYPLGLDQEIISSLEAIHDEIYFDTLDFLRGITDVELEEEELEEDTSRYSAPGNVLPLVHPSSEGKPGRVRIQFDGWQAKAPQIVIQWKEGGKTEHTKTVPFPEFKIKELRIPELTYDGKSGRVANILVAFEAEKESDYLSIIEIIHAYRELLEKDLLTASLGFPNLSAFTWRIKHEELVKEETFPAKPQVSFSLASYSEQSPAEAAVPTDKIISPEMCLNIVSELSKHKTIMAYVGGESYEKRKIPVLEVYTPHEKYVSFPRLITFKPTLYLSGRQHANEVSATNYILKFAELLAKDPTVQEYLKKMNFALHPLENPDGAALAYDLQKITPFHSLHAGRYTSLGIDVGYQVDASKPLLPEAKVRKKLWEKWLPDIYLNLHGYPSHEWVQQFSNYSPYLFRDYWIPRGWFAYFSSVTLPIFKDRMNAGEDLRAYIIKEFMADEKIQASNKKFYDRYHRWAVRWQPHMNYLEIYDGVNLYAKRRSSRENQLSSRRRITFVEETPELMDETAHGPWLHFLSDEGLAYLKAHSDYLAHVQYEIARIEEESQDRIHIQFVRSRPGEIGKHDKKYP